MIADVHEPGWVGVDNPPVCCGVMKFPEIESSLDHQQWTVPFARLFESDNGVPYCLTGEDRLLRQDEFQLRAFFDLQLLGGNNPDGNDTGG
jgi:hypothetical protein